MWAVKTRTIHTYDATTIKGQNYKERRYGRNRRQCRRFVFNTQCTETHRMHEADVKRRFIVVMHKPLPCCACEFRLTSLARYRLDLVTRATSSALLVSNANRRDTTVSFIFPPTTHSHHGDPLPKDAYNRFGYILRIDGALAAHIRPDERNTASALRRACYPIHCLMNGLKGDHVPLLATSQHSSFPEPVQYPPSIPKGHGRRTRGSGAGEGKPWKLMDGSEKLAKGIELINRKHASIADEIETMVIGTATGDVNRHVFILSEKDGDAIDCSQLRSILKEEEEEDSSSATAMHIDDEDTRTLTFVLGDDSGISKDEIAEIQQACGSRILSLGPMSLLLNHCLTIVQYELDKICGSSPQL